MPAINKKDFKIITVIGALVGILFQPIIVNVAQSSSVTLRVGVILLMLVGAPAALLVAYFVGKRIPVLYQFAKFASVGVLNLSIDLGVLNLETFLYGSSMLSNTLFALFKSVSFLCATTNSFFWNKYWTFNATNQVNAVETSKFYIIAVVGWVLNVTVATFVKSIGPTSPDHAVTIWVNIVAPAAGVVGAFLWDFLGYKYLVFKEKSV